MTIATIAGVEVDQNDEGVLTWKSGTDIDADGANTVPFAYRFDDRGTDVLRDAGYPHGGWQSVLEVDQNGHPKTDGNGNIYSKTSYMPPVDANLVPYVVVNPIVRARARGIVLGCHAVLTYGSRVVAAVVADVGPENKIGEMSIAAAKALGIPGGPRGVGDLSGPISWHLYPGVPAVVNGSTYELKPA
jgi:hypothetical protein